MKLLNARNRLYHKVREPNAHLVRACMVELHTVAAHYLAINDVLAELNRTLQKEVTEVDQATPEGRELFHLAKAMNAFERPSITALTVIAVKHRDFGLTHLPPSEPDQVFACGGVPCAE